MARENFFQNKVFILQAILSNGSTNKKLSEFDKKIMQACSRFAASFASESKGPENSETSTSTSEQEIPWWEKFLRVLFVSCFTLMRYFLGLPVGLSIGFSIVVVLQGKSIVLYIYKNSQTDV